MNANPRAKEPLVNLSWHSSYECGNTLIDDQHRGLFSDAHHLLKANLSGCSAEEVTALIDALIDDVVQHFQDEEAICTAAGYPGVKQHAAIHRALVEQALNLAKRFHAGHLAFGDLFHFLACELIVRHMLGDDREFFAYLK